MKLSCRKLLENASVRAPMCLRQSQLGSTYDEHFTAGCQMRMVGDGEETVFLGFLRFVR